MTLRDIALSVADGLDGLADDLKQDREYIEDDEPQAWLRNAAETLRRHAEVDEDTAAALGGEA